jgi:hypothetical protein
MLFKTENNLLVKIYNNYNNCILINYKVTTLIRYIILKDRLTRGSFIYKKVIRCFKYIRGYYLLLKSLSYNLNYLKLYVYNLKA